MGTWLRRRHEAEQNARLTCELSASLPSKEGRRKMKCRVRGMGMGMFRVSGLRFGFKFSGRGEGLGFQGFAAGVWLGLSIDLLSID